MGLISEALTVARRRTASPPAIRSIPTGGTIGGVSIAWTPGRTMLLEGDLAFDRSAASLRCVLWIAQNLASVDLVTLVNGEQDPNDPIARLWNLGTEGAPYSARVVREVLLARAELRGEAFAYIERPAAGGQPIGLHPIFGPVQPLQDGRLSGMDRLTAAPVGFRAHVAGRTVELLPEEVLWLRYPHPLHPWAALAPWKAALGAVESDVLAARWQRSELQNGGRPPAVIGLGDLMPDEHEQAVEEYRTKIEGAENAGRSLLVSSAVRPTVQRLGFTSEELSYLESRTANTDEVCMAHGINPDLFRAGSTYENRAAAKTAGWSDTLIPKLDTVASEVDRQLQPALERVTGFDLTDVDALRESQDAIYLRMVQVVQADVVTLDEARLAIDLEPLPGGIGGQTLTAYRQSLPGAPAPLASGEGDRARRIRSRGRELRLRPAPARLAIEGRRDDLSVNLAAYDRHERIGHRAVRALAARQQKAVLQALATLERKAGRIDAFRAKIAAERDLPVQVSAHPDPLGVHVELDVPDGRRVAADDLFDSRYWAEETAKALDGFLTGAWTEGGDRTATRLGLSFDLFDQRVLTAMAARLDVLADRVTATTHAIIEGHLLHEGVEQGWSIDRLRERLQATFVDLQDWRGAMIARTETVGGFNAASHEVAAASGQVVRRRWLATKDGRTRPTHVEQDGYTLAGTVGVYPNGLRYPGDPTGPPAETIQCRCVELFDVDQEGGLPDA